MATWRRLPFFSKRELDAPTLVHAGIAACCSLDDGGIALADVHGVCHVFDTALHEYCAFGAHDHGVRALVQPRGSGLILSVGLEAEGNTQRACMRIWRPHVGGAATDGTSGTATCTRLIKAFAGVQPEPNLTCCCVSDNLAQVCPGPTWRGRRKDT